jgi:predicted secreted hydrolase
MIWVTAGGCASLREPARRGLVSYEPSRHGSAWEEWPPHASALEWWYLTGVVESSEPTAGGPYLLQFTIFHLGVEPNRLYMLHLACTDYETDRHLFEQYVSFDPRKAGVEGEAIVFRDSRIELLPGGIHVWGEGKDLSMDLSLRISEAPVWHGNEGIISMGHPQDPGENSFYYSFVRLETLGRLSLRRGNGRVVTLDVSGSSWFDRQWGRFGEKGWDWFSLRFFDGDRIMLISFPSTGHREATYASSDGAVRSFDDFDYTVERWVERGGKRYGLGWLLRLPIKGGRYQVVPLNPQDFNPNVANDYWEGLCNLLDESGRPVGWCLTETTAPAHTP